MKHTNTPRFNGGEWRWIAPMNAALRQPIVVFALGLVLGWISA